jgi:hypothetical protein
MAGGFAILSNKTRCSRDYSKVWKNKCEAAHSRRDGQQLAYVYFEDRPSAKKCQRILGFVAAYGAGYKTG